MFCLSVARRPCVPHAESRQHTVPCKRGVPECYVMGSHAVVQLTLRVALTLVHHRSREQCTRARSAGRHYSMAGGPSRRRLSARLTHAGVTQTTTSADKDTAADAAHNKRQWCQGDAPDATLASRGPAVKREASDAGTVQCGPHTCHSRCRHSGQCGSPAP